MTSRRLTARDLWCPKCLVDPGVPCRNVLGVKVPVCHKEREQEAQAVALEGQARRPTDGGRMTPIDASQTDGDRAARAVDVAKAFHEAYERLAPRYSYETRRASAVPWDDVPADNQALMIGTALDLLRRGVIR